MIGGTGDDLMAGGDAGDLFVFGDGSGDDRVTDFDPDRDRILVQPGVNGTGIDDAGDLAGRLAVDANGDVVIDLGGGNTVTLEGVSIDDLLERPADGHQPFGIDYYPG